MNLLDSILLQQQTLITCRAFFPGSESTFSGVLCYKDGHPAIFIGINHEWDGRITYDVCVFQDRSKTIYSVSYDRMCSRLKELNRIL